MTIADTARSLRHFIGTTAEWGTAIFLSVHDATPELVALASAVVVLVPAAWKPVRQDGGGDTGFVVLSFPNENTPDGQIRDDMGIFPRSVTVHGVPRPRAWVAPDPGQPHDRQVDKTVCAAMVGLAAQAQEAA